MQLDVADLRYLNTKKFKNLPRLNFVIESLRLSRFSIGLKFKNRSLNSNNFGNPITLSNMICLNELSNQQLQENGTLNPYYVQVEEKEVEETKKQIKSV